MKAKVHRGMIVAIACAVGACAPANGLLAKTGTAGARYSSNGKVTFHRGQPCTSQIMFDFRPAGSKAVIWLAANAHDSNKLSDAAHDRRGVRITGIWKRGRETGCGYVEVNQVTVETSWWSKVFKP